MSESDASAQPPSLPAFEVQFSDATRTSVAPLKYPRDGLLKAKTVPLKTPQVGI